MHFAFLIVFLLIECLKFYVQWRHGLVANNPAFSTNNLTAFISNLFLAQSLNLTKNYTFNFPSWSISAEFYTYILFALLLMVLGKRKYFLLGATGICGVCFAIFSRIDPTTVNAAADVPIIRCLTGFFWEFWFFLYTKPCAVSQRQRLAHEL